MYESMTYERILERMIDRALQSSRNLDSREGSLLWLAEAPAAVELQNLYIALDNILKETFADTASREYLILRAKEQGLSPYPATAAVLQMSITPITLSLSMGARFSIGEMNYFVSESLGGGNYAITCETPGEAGNEISGPVIPIEYVDGLETCTITARLIPGEDEEDTEVFRQRYLDSLASEAFGGNKADYIQKVNAIPGVGGVRVYRVWNGSVRPADMIPPPDAASWIAGLTGVSASIKTWLETVHKAGIDNFLTVGGTVKLVLIDSTFSSPSNALVDLVQTQIDPTQNAGEGVGLAPLGHVVRIVPVDSEAVDLTLNLSYQSGWTWPDVEPYVRQTVGEYFTELARTWAEQEISLVVRVSQIESRLLGLAGILDIQNTQLNGQPSNLTLGLDSIPVLGTLTAI